MSDRTPEQVVNDAVNGCWDDDDPVALLAAKQALDALRAEGMLVEEGEVKVRLDGLEERLRVAFCEPDMWVPELAPAIAFHAARVVRGETQEADR